MENTQYYCPLLAKNIDSQHCLDITYATEGRIPHDKVADVDNWEKARDICADCGNAYWNKNNLKT